MFYIMINHEETADTAESLDEARKKGQTLCDAELLPCTFAIYDDGENFVEELKRTDGRDLSEQIADFNRTHELRNVAGR